MVVRNLLLDEILNSQTYEPELNLLEIGQILAVRWKLVVAIVVSFLAIGLLLKFQASSASERDIAETGPPNYVASSMYQVMVHPDLDLALSERLRLANESVGTVAHILTTPSVLSGALGHTTRETDSDSGIGTIKTRVQPGTALIWVTATDASGPAATALANRLSGPVLGSQLYADLGLDDLIGGIELVQPAVVAETPPISLDPWNSDSSLLLYVMYLAGFGLFIAVILSLFVERWDRKADRPRSRRSEGGLSTSRTT